MQAPQSLEELENTINAALAESEQIELSGLVSKELAQDAVKELLAAIRETQESGAPLTPCQRLVGEAIIQFVQLNYRVKWT